MFRLSMLLLHNLYTQIIIPWRQRHRAKWKETLSLSPDRARSLSVSKSGNYAKCEMRLSISGSVQFHWASECILYVL